MRPCGLGLGLNTRPSCPVYPQMSSEGIPGNPCLCQVLNPKSKSWQSTMDFAPQKMFTPAVLLVSQSFCSRGSMAVEGVQYLASSSGPAFLVCRSFDLRTP